MKMIKMMEDDENKNELNDLKIQCTACSPALNWHRRDILNWSNFNGSDFGNYFFRSGFGGENCDDYQ